jgi:hypothetical protein
VLLATYDIKKQACVTQKSAGQMGEMLMLVRQHRHTLPYSRADMPSLAITISSMQSSSTKAQPRFAQHCLTSTGESLHLPSWVPSSCTAGSNHCKAWQALVMRIHQSASMRPSTIIKYLGTTPTDNPVLATLPMHH